MDLFDLSGYKKSVAKHLSGGYKQRFLIARSLTHSPKLIILDEPTVGLDIAARRKLLDHLKDKAKTGLTIFYTTHILSEVEYICDEIAIINHGKILTVDTPEAIKSKFGNAKTIKIRIATPNSKISKILSDIQDCKVQINSGTDILIHSDKSEFLLQRVLKILNENDITVDDISVLPSSLEEIFLKIVGDSNTSNN